MNALIHGRILEGIENEDKILRYLRGRDPEHWPSSVREICDAVGLASSSTVHKHLRRLEQGGYVEREGRKGFRAVRRAA